MLNFDYISESKAKLLELLVAEDKRPPYLNSTPGFDELFTVIGILWFCTGLPNFMQIGWVPTDLFYNLVAIASPIYFWFLIWPRLNFRKVQRYRHTKFRPDLSIHGRDITTSGFWKQTAAILKFYTRFRFWPFYCHWHVVFRRHTKLHQNRIIRGRVMTL